MFTHLKRLVCGSAAIALAATVSPVSGQPPRAVGQIEVDSTLPGLWTRAVGRELAYSGDWLHVYFTRGTGGSTRVATAPLEDESSVSFEVAGAVGNVLVVGACTQVSEVYFRTDGTPEGTYRLLTIPSPLAQHSMLPPVQSGQYLYFPLRAEAGASAGLWRTDGTIAGTVQLAAGNFDSLTDVNGRLQCTSYDYVAGTIGVWTSDGTVAGTVQMCSIPGEELRTCSYWMRAAVQGDHWVVARHCEGTTVDLWKIPTDDSGGGPVLQPEFPGGTIGYFVDGAELGLFCVADRPWSGSLWRVNQTASGGSWMASPGGYGGSFYRLQAAGRRLFLAYHDNISGTRLWMSDGTSAGTGLLMEINPVGDDGIGNFTAAGSSVYFAANDGVHGRELWTSDGTLAGTHMVSDLAPGRRNAITSNWAAIRSVNSRLYFQANDGQPGRNLWMLDLCPADFNNDGRVGVQDVFEFLGSFFAGEDLADVDRSGVVDTGDLYSWLATWFEGCPAE